MRLVLFLLVGLMAGPAVAGQMVEEAPLEPRVRQVATQLRCPVCQSENILDSHSGTAREMLDLVREQVAEGRSDDEITAFFQARYGNYVLLSPPAHGAGRVIWLIPGLLAIGGAGLGVLLVRRLRRQDSELEPTAPGLTESRLRELEP